MLNLNVTNVGNLGREIFVWHRIGKSLMCLKENFYGYFYRVDSQGTYQTIDRKKVKKIICKHSLIKNRDQTYYEADLPITKRYIIDKLNVFGKADLKFCFMDIEVLAKKLPTYKNPEYPVSSIACSNSYTEEIKTWFLGDYKEEELLNNFVNWIKQEQFDLVLGWHFLEFDWRYLLARYKKLFNRNLAEELSPINKARLIGSKDEPIEIPVGIGVCDYLEFYKKIYKTDSSYALDVVAQKRLNETSYEKVDFGRLSDDIKEKNINDVKRMVNLDKKLKIIDYYDQLRIMSMCDWSEVHWNSKVIDMILLKEAKQKGIILPSKHYDREDEESFEGAYRRGDGGFYKGLWKLDLASAYPMAVVNFCLDIANIRKNEGLTINTVRFYQNANALLPTVATKLISKKDTLKKQLKQTNPTDEHYQDLQIKYDAIKGVVNSLFGVTGLKVFRLFNPKIPATITFLIRDLLHYVEEKLKEKEINVVYIDTDSLMIEAKENPETLCNDLVNEWAKEKYGKDKIGIKFETEGIFENLFVVALCHYKGYLRLPNGKIKEEVKGLEIRRKDSSNFIREFQNTLLEKIMNEEPKEKIVEWINNEKERIKTLPATDIGFPARLTKEDKEYKTIITNAKGTIYQRKLPIHIRAKNNGKKIFENFDKQLGDNYWWIYYEE